MKRNYKFSREQNINYLFINVNRIAQVRIGTAFNDDISETTNYILDDHLGSSNARLDDSGSIIDRQEYYPFGDTSLRTYSFKRYQYVGKEKDAESGLIYYGARYYAAWTCRFISVDPLAHQFPFLTPYQNASNEVINFVDIEGLQKDGEKPEPASKNTEGTEFLTEKAEITEAGEKRLSSYPKEVVHAVEKFANEVQTYLKENKGATIDEAIDATNIATQDEEWVYISYKRNNNATNWDYDAQHAGLVFKTLNFKEGEPEIKREPLPLLSDRNVLTFVEENFNIPWKNTPEGIRIVNDAPEAPMILDLFKGGDFAISDSTIAAGDSLEVLFTKKDAGTYLGINLQLHTGDVEGSVGRPRLFLLRKEKTVASGLKIAPEITSSSDKITLERMKKEFQKEF